ncbi:MAG: methyltransferase domain-containing protein [Desulfopila sp.]
MNDARDRASLRSRQGYRQVEIRDRDNTRSLYFGGRYLQSQMDLRSPHRLLLPYTQYMMFSLLLVVRPARVLLLGLGGGSLLRFLNHHFPDCEIEAVDISSQVIRLATDYFHLPTSSRVRIRCQDGRQFLDQAAGKTAYDLILLDAFDEEGLVGHMYREKTFTACAAALADGGLLVANLWSGGPLSAEEIDHGIAPLLPCGLLLPVPGRGNVITIRARKTLAWQKIGRNRTALAQLESHYDLDFGQMIKVARRANLSLGQRLVRAVTDCWWRYAPSTTR